MDNIRGKGKEKKELLRHLQEQDRAETIVHERKLSANERELNRFLNEHREESIKEQLNEMRKERDNEIKFGHNPLDTPNITNHVDWEVLKERNMFKAKKNMFSNQPMIHRSNPKLLNNAKWLMK